MKRAEIVDASAPLQIVTVDIPEVPKNGALLKTTFAGICHSDLHIIQDEAEILPGKITRRRDVLPKLGALFSGIVLGHEIAGTIEAFGPEAKPRDHGLRVGDRVMVHPWIGCEKCETCLVGQTNECANNPMMFNTYGGGPVHPGGYSTHVAVHNLAIIVKIPDSISQEIAAMLPCSALTAFTALKKVVPSLQEGISRNKCGKLLIVGAGGLGLWCTQLAKLLFAAGDIQVTVADVGTDKLQIAKECGADLTTQWKTKYDNFSDIMKEAEITTDKKSPFDATIDFVGLPNTFNIAYRCLRKGGTIIPVGLFGGMVDLPLIELVARNMNIQGNYVGTISDMKELVNLLKDKGIRYPAVELTTLDDINHTFDRLRNGKISGRAVIKF